MSIAKRLLDRSEKLAVVGLGYVGLPLAAAFAKKVPVIGFDINPDKIELYRKGIDPTNEIGNDELRSVSIEFTAQEKMLHQASFIIVAVPTPVDNHRIPELAPIESVCRIIGRNLQKGAIIIFESTVYPGTTEDICIPILERVSRYKCGKDFFVGYSPERINPGDRVHRLENMVKLVSGIDQKTAEQAAEVYELIISAGAEVVSSIKVAETAKLAENAQRDVNIAFMNELAITLDRMDIRTADVIAAMNTKWNALGFRPGLVGGHCISVDPYYLIHKSEEVKGRSDLVQSSRKINNSMSCFVADVIIRQIIHAGGRVKGSRVGIMGITYKQNCPDTRNTMVPDIMKRLAEYGVETLIFDPVARPQDVLRNHDITLSDKQQLCDLDCLVFAVGHKEFIEMPAESLPTLFRSSGQEKPVLIDIPSILSKDKMEELGMLYWSL